MTDKKFKSTARRHKAIALGIAIVFHIGLFSMFSSPNPDTEAEKGYLPGFVKEWFQKDDVKKEEAKKATKNA